MIIQSIRFFHFAMAIVLLYGAYDSLLTPHTQLYAIIHLVAAGLTVVSLWKKLWWGLPAALCLGCGLAAVSLAEKLPKQTSLFQTHAGQTVFWLLLVSGWMGILLFVNRMATVPSSKKRNG